MRYVFSYNTRTKFYRSNTKYVNICTSVNIDSDSKFSVDMMLTLPNTNNTFNGLSPTLLTLFSNYLHRSVYYVDGSIICEQCGCVVVF